MIEAKVVFIRSRRIGFGSGHDGHPSLGCNPDGEIQSNTFGRALEWETWKLKEIDANKIALQAWTGKFLSGKHDGTVRADADEIGEWETWRVEPGSGVIKDQLSYVGILSYFGKYLSCDNFHNCGDTVSADREHMNVWEHWSIVDDSNVMTSHGKSIVHLRNRRTAFARDGHPSLKCNPDGYIQANTFGTALGWETWKIHSISDSKDNRIALQSWTGKFLAAKPDGTVWADADEINEWETWTMKKDEGPFIGFVSHFGTFLTCDNLFACGKSVKADRGEMNEWENWVIVNDPNVMTNPGHTASLALKGSILAAGAIVSLGALAIPALGFAATGVVAGSPAARIQSAVYGGAACGVFSALQSTGASMSWVPAAAGGGAITTVALMLKAQGN